MSRKLFTSESVTEGHPDKISDKISDAILDEMLRQDPMSRVACETFCTTGLVCVMGEVTTKAQVDIQNIVRETVRSIGYDRAKYGFDCDSCAVITSLHAQSPDIAMGVDKSLEAKSGADTDGMDIGAGDQGLMFGYACNETPELMPLPIALSHALAKRLTEVRKNGTLPYLRPDGKTQVTIEYDENDKPVRVDTIVISSQHSASVTLEEIRRDLIKEVIDPIVPTDMMDGETKIYINPTGRFVVGGPAGDTGLTGRKIIVDTYGGYARHGGGAFSGKDPTKVDRSACYAARYIAKNVVKAGLSEKCEVQLAYAIGVAKPVSVMIDTFGTAKVDEAKIEKAILELVDLRPAAIIKRFDLRRPIYCDLAAYGHMGREDVNAPWENCDLVDELKKLI
ncbi:MAG: methionine adenosyltransferase [Ruminococcaceae bacterium]|nr:methionine adenosyltransferase [Oscillospiraceae bacterium]